MFLPEMYLSVTITIRMMIIFGVVAGQAEASAVEAVDMEEAVLLVAGESGTGDAEQIKILKNYQTPRKFMYSYLSYLTIY